MTPDGPTFLFLHVMKTGGTSLLGHAWERFGRYGVEPPLLNGDPRPPGTSGAYESVARVRDLPQERRAAVRFYAGHYPFLVREIVRPDITLTVLREPVSRTVSILRQVQQLHRRLGGRPLAEIYDDPMVRASMVRDFQVRQFAMTWVDLDEHAARIAAFTGQERPERSDTPHLVPVTMDDQRLEQASANLAQVDEIGLQEDYDGFLARLRARFGWPPGGADVRLRTASAGEPVPPDLLARITEDLHWDRAFYERAVGLCAARAS